MDSHSSPLQTVKAAWASFERAGYEGMLEHAGEEAEWVTRDGKTFQGRDEIQAHLDEVRSKVIAIEPRAYSFEEHGPCIVVAGGLRTRAQDGLSDVQRHWVFRVERGEIVYLECLASREEALETVERVCQLAA